MELLESLASYIGIALQNASLYARLEVKISEFERLKEFNENIVESINVGILALDLEDRIESWNAQMEAMYAVSRGEAIGQKLGDVFPDEFVSAIEGFRNEAGVHHLYKFHLTTKAGEQRTVNIAIAPLLSRDFVIVGRIVLVDDITERVSLETSSHRLTSSVPLACSPPVSRTKSTHRSRSSPRTRRCSPSRCAATPASVPCSRRSRSRASALPKLPTAC